MQLHLGFFFSPQNAPPSYSVNTRKPGCRLFLPGPQRLYWAQTGTNDGAAGRWKGRMHDG